MNDNEAILAELKKISTWADMQRKMTKRSFVFLAIFIPVIVIYGVLMERLFTTKGNEYIISAENTWYDVERNIRLCDLNEAIRIGEKLIQTTPLYPNGHVGLGSAYLAKGNIGKAQEHFAEAVRLFPSEDNISLLNAADIRIRQANLQSAEVDEMSPLQP